MPEHDDLSELQIDTQTDTRSSSVDDGLAGLDPRVPGLVILAHPDGQRVGEVAALPELVSAGTVCLSRLEPTFAQPHGHATFRPLAESHLSREPFRITPGPEPGDVAIERGACRTRLQADGVALDHSRIFSQNDLDDGVVLVLAGRVVLLLCRVDPVPTSLPHFGLVGESSVIAQLRHEIKTAAGLSVPVLLRGETGTGKELVARALHDASRRSHGPYRTVNMGALPPSLAASELFGAARGAFTGADRRKEGFFTGAHGGTLFLDEIGEVPPEVQVLLLRALESHEIQPVGSTETRKVDVRVIAATDADLEAAIAEGRFRAPLLHRLAAYEITVPPLRQRRDDIPRLLEHFLRLDAEEHVDTSAHASGDPSLPVPPLPVEILERLVGYAWPGNVRQLRNVARRLAVAQRASRRQSLNALLDTLLREGSPSPSGPSTPAPSATAGGPPSPQGPGDAVPRRWLRRQHEVGEEELLAALADHHWELRPTARALGVSRATLYRLIEQCPRIRKASELSEQEIRDALAAHDGQHIQAARHLEVSPQGLKRRMTALGLG